jgi:low affinity Fe/Cu permease
MPGMRLDMTIKDKPQKSTTPRKAAERRRNAAPHRDPGGFSRVFGAVANRTSQAAGRASTFILAAGVILVWAITGPLFQYSDTWQLVINTGTTIVTFLMVFLIQNSQNRDSAAIQVKLDELIRVSTAQNSFVGIEHLTDEELEEIRSKCERRAEADKDDDPDGEDLVKRTSDKATKAAERAVAAE